MALSELERAVLDESLADSGCRGFLGDHPELYAAAEAIVREHVAAALNAAADEITAYVWRPGDGTTMPRDYQGAWMCGANDAVEVAARIVRAAASP